MLAVRIACGLIGAALIAAAAPVAAAQPVEQGKEEFGMTPRQLVQVIEKVEAAIEKCMRAQGFEYVAADYDTVRKGMSSDKTLPGMSEAEFIDKYGSGVSTLYTGLPPQLVEGYSPCLLYTSPSPRD